MLSPASSSARLRPERAKLLAYKVIREAIEVGAYGLGHPIDIWEISKAGAKQAPREEVLGLEDAARALREREVELLLGEAAAPDAGEPAAPEPGRMEEVALAGSSDTGGEHLPAGVERGHASPVRSIQSPHRCPRTALGRRASTARCSLLFRLFSGREKLRCALDPLAGLVAERLGRLPWHEGSLPVHVAGGLPLPATAAGARTLAVIRSLRAHLSGDDRPDALRGAQTHGPDPGPDPAR
jgi:hypothetical protein